MLKSTPIVEVGKKIVSFSLPDPQGQIFTLEELKGKNGTLIAFICNHCPYVIAIAKRLAADARTLKKIGVHVIGINSNDFAAYPADRPEMMAVFAESNNFDFPYLVDEDQTIARAYGAVCTPDFFGYNASGDLQYRGRLDDARMGDSANRVPELVEGMELVASTGVGPKSQFPSQGCSLKWKS